MTEINHLGIDYIKLTNDDHPAQGDIIYRMPQPEDGDIEPLICEVTRWGSMHHGEADNYLIEVLQTYPESFKKKILAGCFTRKERKDMQRELLPRRTFYCLDRMWRKK